MGVWKLERDGRVAVITMEKPPLNLIYFDDLVELGGMLQELEHDEGVGAVILTGTGKAFVGGADITQFTRLDPVTAKLGLRMGQKVLRDMEEMPKPVVAAVNGYAFGGGCEIALACDIRIASEKAKFGQLEINYGVIPGWSGTQRLTKVVGFGRAKDMVLTGRIVGADEAYAMGLVTRLASPESLMEEALALANGLASKPPVAMAYAKEMVNVAAEAGIPLGSALEAAACAITFGTEDVQEGVKAFLENRDPDFKGR